MFASFKSNLIRKLLKYPNINRKFVRLNNESAELLPMRNGNLAIVSTSNNIFYNLALESYLAETTDLKHRSILLLWISSPSIVFGRHQNPWLECNVNKANLNQVKLARRYSGGGCVYHDLGNLNISFICDRLLYNRTSNLNLIKQTLDSCNFEGVSFEIGPRHDIFMRVDGDKENAFKISGSASRLAQKFSYHHCTLLFEAELDKMGLLRSNIFDQIKTKATPSVRSKCLNINRFIKKSNNLNMNEIIIKLCTEYWKLNPSKWGLDHLFKYVNPEEETIAPHLKKYLKELTSWEHIYGETPKFQLEVNLNQLNSHLNVHVEKGMIKELESNSDSLKQDLRFLIGSRLHRDEVLESFKSFELDNDSNAHLKHVLEFFNKNI
jgi:lipoyltransferase 1